MRTRIIMLVAVSIGIGPFMAAQAIGQEVASKADVPALIAHEDLEWVEIIPGVDFATVYGDWAEGAHAKFARFAPGMVAPLHTHTHAYHGVVVQGQFTNPYPGEEGIVMGPGDYWYVPAGLAHGNECVSDEACIFFTYGDALWDVEMVEN